MMDDGEASLVQHSLHVQHGHDVLRPLRIVSCDPIRAIEIHAQTRLGVNMPNVITAWSQRFKLRMNGAPESYHSK